MSFIQKIAETTYANGQQAAQLELRGNALVVTDGPSAPDPTEFCGHSSNGGVLKVSGRYGSRGAEQEIGYLFIKRDERYSTDPSRAAGEVEIWVRKPDAGSTDQAVVKRLRVSHDGVVLYDGSGHPIVVGVGNGAPTGQIALRTVHGKYLRCWPDGRVDCVGEAPGPWETLEVVHV